MRIKPRTVIIYVVLIGAVVASGTLAYAAVSTKSTTPQTNTRTVAAQNGTVSQTVSATGNLEPATSTVVTFGTGGTITEIDVKEGDTVTAGQVIAKVDPADAQSALNVAQLNYSAAVEKYNSAQSAATSTTTTRTATSSGQASSASPTQSDASSVYSAQASMIQAQASLDTAQKALDATTLEAPVAGTVTVINNAVGDKVSGSTTSSSSSSSSTGSTGSTGATGSSGSAGGAGGSSGGAAASSSSSSSSSSGFLTIVDPKSYQVKVAFPEADAVKVKVDQPASISVDALTGVTLTGKVTKVDTTATVTSNVVTYSALISVDNPPANVKSGMTVTVTVTTASKANVVVVSTAAVETAGNQSFVTKEQNGQQVRTPVTVGLQGDSTTEITSGLAAGDQVVIATGSITTNSTTAGGRTAGAGGGGGIGGAGGAGGFGGAGGAGGFGGAGGGAPGGGR